jgi:hypothetical protein
MGVSRVGTLRGRTGPYGRVYGFGQKRAGPLTYHPEVADKRLYKVAFQSQGQVYEVYAKRVSQGGLLGFVEVEGLVFGERASMVVDPTEERLQREFAGVKRCYLPMHSILRIDEVEKAGPGRITEATAKGDNVAAFPMPYVKPGRDSES